MRIELETHLEYHGGQPVGQYEASCPPLVGTRVEIGDERYTVGWVSVVLGDGEPYARVRLYTGLQAARAGVV